MPEIVTMAKKRGIPVSPILTAYAVAVGRNQAAQPAPVPTGASQ
jgi:hypothetical protein